MSLFPRIFVQTAPRKIGLRSISSVVPKISLDYLTVKNEPILEYKAGSKERKELECTLSRLASTCQEIPIVIGKEELYTKDVKCQVMPHFHTHQLAKYSYADETIIQKAIKVATAAQKVWDRTSLKQRILIWERAADLMAGKYRQELNAATMLGQSKTIGEAEIDSAAELIDFMRLNAHFLAESTKYKPISENKTVAQNFLRHRGIEGFIASISPFNFTAIGGNLAYTPVLMGNAVLWKPSDTAILANWITFKVMREAGVPPGVVNFIPADGPVFGNTITTSPNLAGINFTGSVPTFCRLWKQVGQNLECYKNFPRIVGEVGGKNFHFVHNSAEVAVVIAQTIRGAFGYLGQKCSACSRMYVPESLWEEIQWGLLEERKKIKVGDVTDFNNFAGAVIDAKAFNRIVGYIEYAKKCDDLTILGGGGYTCETGYFVEPTIIETCDPMNKIMQEEIFGPVLTIYVYKENELESTMDLVNTTTRFALTGSVFARDEQFLLQALEHFKMSAGNFYINDKCTGAIVGQQPFGGGRMSGTNDKAGGPHYILRWSSMQAIKETYSSLLDIDYPYMQ